MNAPCAGQWELFDSVELEDHIRARAICDKCPLIDACRARLSEARKLAARCGPDTGPVGTWAGQHVGVKPQREVSPIKHGTITGAYAHRNRKVMPLCEACKNAERIHRNAVRAERRKAAAA